jgi:hypothetical protein
VLLAGVVGVGVGTYYLSQSHSSEDQAKDHFDNCAPFQADPGTRACSADESVTIDKLDRRAKDDKASSKVAFVVGGLGLGVGAALLSVYLFQDNGHSQERASSVRLTPWVSYNGAGVSGQF